jgi:hypothetical protein
MQILKHFPYPTPMDGQRKVLTAIEANWNNADVFVVTAPTACHGAGDKVVMADGTLRRIETIQQGDILLGPDSTPREVLGLHTGRSKLYTVSLKDGHTFRLTGSHVLVLEEIYSKGKGKKKTYHRRQCQVTVENYLKTSRYRKHCLYFKKTASMFPQAELEIPPYILGLWLGDGDSDSVGLTTMDDCIRKEWEAYGMSKGLYCRVEDFKNNNKAKGYHLTRGRGQVNPVLNSLRSLKVLNNKHIPDCYIHASREQRLELLAGIIDTDGHKCRHTQASAGWELTQKSRQLIDGIKRLCDSLGFRCGLPRAKEVNGETYWRINFSGNEEEDVPVRLNYKKGCNRSMRDATNCAFSITEEPDEDTYYGVTVDKDNLYLLEGNYITHNSGKTAISLALMRWAWECGRMKGIYAAPNNILVQQFLDAFPKSVSLHRKDHYTCMYERPLAENCAACPKLADKECPNSPYLKAVRRAHVVPWLVCNTYTYLAHKLYAPLVIFDEGHGLVNLAKERCATNYWHKDWHFPQGIRNYGQLISWLDSFGEGGLSPKLQALRNEIEVHPPKYLIQKSLELYHGRQELCLRKLPVEVSDKCGFLWPQGKNPKKSVQKIVLLSATINKQDIADMGLDSKRVLYLEAESPIPIERRPVYVRPIANMSYASQDREMPKLVDFLLEKLNSEEGRGFIHVTYGLSAKLRRDPRLVNHPRLMWHDREDRTEKYAAFKESSREDLVFVASGMEEGVSLDYELARWQVIAKCPYPSLAEPAIRYLAEQRPEWYKWETLKKLTQACGRVCRTPTDFGKTYIVDSSALRLLREGATMGLIPHYLKEALIYV